MTPTIGLDVGGTKITGIVFDGKKVLDELTIKTPSTDTEFARNLIKLTDFLSAKQKISGVGIGIAGLADPQKGVLKYSENFKFPGRFDLVKIFKQSGYTKVRIDNDADCFARAELILGQGKSLENFLAITLGTGIGGAIVINKHIYRGANNTGAEFGHIVLDNDFVESLFQKLRDKKDFKAAGHLVGKLLASLVNVFAPDAIIIGGGYGHNESANYLSTAKLEMKKYFFNEKAKTKILVTKLKNAGALGAALMVK